MILIDSNIISIFAKIDKLDLLFIVFNKPRLYISANVFREIMVDKEREYAYAEKIFDLIEKHIIEIATPDENELLLMVNMPRSLGSGELDSIAICKTRGAILLSNDRKVINYCKRENIACFDLCDILGAAWKYMILRKDEVMKMIDEIEKKDNVYILNKYMIFEE